MKHPLTVRLYAALALILLSQACGLPTKPPDPPVAPSATATASAAPVPSSTPVQPEPTLQAQPPTQAQPPAYQAVFEPADCAFRYPPEVSAECGYLVVPENRAIPGSPQIRLHVARFTGSSGSRAADPVVFLSGGPGESALRQVRYLFSLNLVALLEHRDFIVIDQRGTGYSQPRLDCPERYQLTAYMLENRPGPEEASTAIIDSFRRCQERLEAAGVDLSAYTSAASAADINDLRLALGIERLNLYGVSYGTRLALTIMRDFPDGVRSAVLDSVYPPQENLYTPLAPNAERAFNILFDRCAADPACSSNYPNLKDVFYDLVDRLNAEPLPVTVFDGNSDRIVRVDGSLLIDVLFVGMYNPSVTAGMPGMIYAVRSGNGEILRERLSLYFDRGTAYGMQMSVHCAESLPFSSAEEAYATAEGVQPQIANFFPVTVAPLFSVCQSWNPGPYDPKEDLPVTGDVPALVLSGEFDPITPPAWAQETAAKLSHAYAYEFAGNGHWVTRSSDCAQRMALAFWENPETAPDAACLAEQPENFVFR